jgi:hypothetical protein
MPDIYHLSTKLYSVDGVDFLDGVDFVDFVDFVECVDFVEFVDGVNAIFPLQPFNSSTLQRLPSSFNLHRDDFVCYYSLGPGMIWTCYSAFVSGSA